MKKISTTLLLLASLLASFTSFAQRNCATMDVLEQQLQEHPEMRQNMQRLEEFTQEYIQNGIQGRTVVTIPVVVHVLYNTSAENISDAQIMSQLTVLNDDFRRLNSDADGTWPQASDSEVEFCLATVDPNGSGTTGIRRIPTSVGVFGLDDSMKFSSSGGADAWPAGDYLNLWVCDITSGYLGYAQFPGGPANTDGVVIDYQYFGTTGTATAPFDLGRTATHEVGHWLNLRHIWGDGGCGADDFVADTPGSNTPNYGCPNRAKHCGSDDMYQNYMDYTDDDCMNLFTAGQAARMQAALAGPRSSLLGASDVKCDGTHPVSEICDNGIDDDGDGDIDCADSDCSGATNCQPIAEICNNGIDDDGDGDIDCADADCSGAANCQSSGGCDDPTGLATNVTKGGREADLSWNAVSGATSYDIILCTPSAPTNCTAPFNTSSTAVTATGLTKGASYEWCVTANCGSNGSSAQVCQSFVASPGGRLSAPVSNLTIYPNPARDQVVVDLTNMPASGGVISLSNQPVDQRFFLEMVDMSGRTVQRFESNYSDSIIELDVADVSGGLYLIKVSDMDGNLEATGKVMIMKD